MVSYLASFDKYFFIVKRVYIFAKFVIFIQREM